MSFPFFSPWYWPTYPGTPAPSDPGHYHVYSSAGMPGPTINYASLISSVAGLSFDTAPLAPGSDNAFGVRAFDPATSLEESNVDARVRIVLDAAGNDITARPLAPLGMSALGLAGAGIRVHWLRNPLPSPVAGAPTGYHVYIGSPVVNLARPVARVLDTGGRDYQSTITPETAASYSAEEYWAPTFWPARYYGNGPALITSGLTYQVVVRAYNATSEETNLNIATVTTDSVGPAPVDGLTVVATFAQ